VGLGEWPRCSEPRSSASWREIHRAFRSELGETEATCPHYIRRNPHSGKRPLMAALFTGRIEAALQPP
jgi:hypothetical protein